MNFWNTDTEIRFFEGALQHLASPEQLFYRLHDGYFAYAPRGKTTEGQTLQSRNSLIGQYTEKWCNDFFQPIASELGLFAVNGVVCPDIGLTNSTDADVALCTTEGTNQPAGNIKLIFEVKMSIVNNYSLDNTTHKVKFEGDYKSHRGNPSILRSDSMLKAIGKAINIRVSGMESTRIPIIVLGNSPITDSYKKKVDFLKRAGVIQSFISLYPNPTQNYIRETPGKGFQTLDGYKALKKIVSDWVLSDMNFFSAMLPKKKLGEIIAISAEKLTEIEKAERCLKLLNELDS